MKSVLVIAALITATPALANDLLHCTVNNTQDGFFTTLDLNVDGVKISGSATVQGKTLDIGKDLFATFITSNDGKLNAAIVYQVTNTRTEAIWFSLPDVVSKLGQGTRYSEQGDRAIEHPVSIICDIAAPI